MRRRLWLVLQLAMTIGLGVVLAKLVDRDRAAAVLGDADWTLLGGGLALLFVVTGFMSWRWHLILTRDGVSAPAARLYATYLESTFFGLFLPSGIGGDVARGARVHKLLGSSLKRTSVNLIADRLFSLCTVAALGLVSVAIDDTVDTTTARAVWIACLGVFAVSFLGLSQLTQGPINNLLRRLGLDRLAALQIDVLEQIRAYMDRSRLIVGIVAISIVQQFVMICAVWLCARAAGVNLPFLLFVTIMPVVALLSLVPAIGGLGPREAGLAFSLAKAGATKEQAIAAAALLYVAMVGRGIAGAVIFLTRTLRSR